MGLKKSDRITMDFVLERVDDFNVFTAYFGDFVINKKSYHSVFRKDDDPSTGFYIGKSGKIVYNDIVTNEKLDCFAFVAKLHKITYGEAIKKVACDFGLIACKEGYKFKISDIRKAQVLPDKKETTFEVEADKWIDADLDFWKQYHIEVEELEKNEVAPILSLKINGVDIPNYSKNVRFVYTIRWGDREYKKIYTPYAQDKKFKFLQNVPIYIPFGLDSLPYESDTLIITKSLKDKIIFNKYFTDVIGTQSESPAALREQTVKFLQKRYKTIYINFDIDKAGKENILPFIEMGLIPLMLPDVCYDKHKIKDVSDFVRQFGLDRFEKFLKFKKVL